MMGMEGMGWMMGGGIVIGILIVVLLADWLKTTGNETFCMNWRRTRSLRALS